MADNTGKNIGSNGPVLNVGNPGNSGGGRPPEEFKRECGEKLAYWLARASARLSELDTLAENDEDMKFKVVDASGKLAERFGKYTGLEKAGLNDPGATVIRVVFDKEPEAE